MKIKELFVHFFCIIVERNGFFEIKILSGTNDVFCFYQTSSDTVIV
jgi:hypothetical protein